MTAPLSQRMRELVQALIVRDPAQAHVIRRWADEVRELEAAKAQAALPAYRRAENLHWEREATS